MIKESIKINCSATELFNLSQDYTKRLNWDSFLKEARLLNAQKPSVGVKSFCRAWNGIGIESEYITFKEPHVVAVKMTKGPWLFREFAATWRFQDEGTLTHLTFIYHFRTRFVPEMVVGFILKREMRRRLQDLKNYGESVK